METPEWKQPVEIIGRMADAYVQGLPRPKGVRACGFPPGFQHPALRPEPRTGQIKLLDALRNRAEKKDGPHALRPKRLAVACVIAAVGTFSMPVGWLLTLGFFRTRKGGAVLMGLIQGLHGLNYAFFPRPSDQSMIETMKVHPFGSIAFEIAGAIAVGTIFYWIGATRVGRFLYDDVAAKQT
ncbi:hypothetical protein ACFOD9_01480 [Novosphingobium bradum]|uniref:DUF2062 domain-containing protein n=1 Tax=Novosphingobium bradum TaxID=1737444 RepID=A0ABV7INS0_9SPHN